MKRVNIGVVGFGGIAKVHALACYALKLHYHDLPFAANILKAYRREKPQDRGIFQEVVTSLDDLLQDPDIDLIDICSPNHVHYEQVKKALEAGKAVYCEKPLALNYQEAAALVQLAEAKNLMNQVAFMYRFMPAVVKAREYFRNGELGEILHFKFILYHKGYLNERPLSWREQRKFSGGGAIMDLGIHLVDLVRYILGDISSVRAELFTFTKERFFNDADHSQGKARVDVDEYAKLDVRLQKGGLGTIECSRISSSLHENTVIEIYGSQGSIKVTDAEPRYPVIHRHAENITSIGDLALLENLTATHRKGNVAAVENRAGVGNSASKERADSLTQGSDDEPFYEFCQKIYPSAKTSLGPAVDMHLTSLYNMLLNLSVGKIVYEETPTFREGAMAQRVIQMALLSQQEENRWVKWDEVD